ncbi:AP-3 complex subunit mu-2 [Balamuthia mandrillaris]
MTVQSIFILSSSGEVIIEKHYNGLVNRTICDRFWEEVARCKDPKDVLPVIVTSRWYLIHIQHNGLFFLATVQKETSPLLVFEFLNRLVEVFHHYMSEITEDNIKDKFVIVYQVLDEMMDGGFPFMTEPNILTAMINNTNILTDIMDSIPGKIPIGNKVGGLNLITPGGVSEQLPRGVSTTIPWRTVGMRYTANEIYFDLMEYIDCIIGRTGRIVNCEVYGDILVNCKLSGMPDLTLVFRNPRVLEDVSFHPCIRLLRWDQNRVISFVPPDGNFKLMSYRVSGGNLEIPIYVTPQISFAKEGGRVSITVGPRGIQRKPVDDIRIVIPFSPLISSTNLTANCGSVEYDEIKKVCTWIVGRLPADKTCTLSGTVSVPPDGPLPESNPILQVHFKVNQHAASGLKIDSLSLHNEKYKPYKGVKSVTQTGRFQVRT